MGEEQEGARNGPSSPVDGLMTPQDYAAAIRSELDRLEALARAATPGPWVAHEVEDGVEPRWYVRSEDEDRIGPMEVDFDRDYGSPLGGCSHPDAVHIAAHGRQRVLARIADDRQRVERDLATLDDHQWDGGMCERCMWGKDPCPDTSRALASLRGLYEALGLTDA